VVQLALALALAWKLSQFGPPMQIGLPLPADFPNPFHNLTVPSLQRRDSQVSLR
jgi:hypothetical protein